MSSRRNAARPTAAAAAAPRPRARVPCAPVPRAARAPRVRGAALLVAMLLLTVVATLASGMVWLQWKAVQVESAERGRAQSAWILNGALDWARLILREDARSGRPTSLNEPWATPLAEARLSSFLSADPSQAGDNDVEAFLAGSIVDAQSRYNLRKLIAEGKIVPAQKTVLERLCQNGGLSPSVATLLSSGLLAAWASGAASADGSSSSSSAPLAPQTVADLAWLGVDAESLRRLAPLVTLLPEVTPVNLNTAPREVLAAVIPGLDLGGADRLVQARQRRAFHDVAEAAQQLGGQITLPAGDVEVKSQYFEVTGRMRLAERVLEEVSLVRRNGLEVLTVHRERKARFAEDIRR
ncbi:type II secretion system minor pseudopilin GspK [Aquabacterium sp. OR-4]|uniref:type II secretion system minor pseudopilin GspK n=1 Tax=Aquabacterium sp. OR-4 TaxID=2978127 RepID=UPI0021B30C18|nr:type II secretion system minor pseudopilin GspK [Aquabacterium sp. OR-4]MDT7837595.1 type II secretion system minor pseudopilin GspK [Aquabacterium sp. OR-4]